MKNISDNLKNKLNNNYIKLIKCFKIILSDGDIIGFTEHSKDIMIDQIIYKSSNGFENTTNLNGLDLNNNSNIIGLVDNKNISIDKVVSGYFDNATIDIFYIDLDDDNLEKILITRGKIKTVNISNGKVLLNIDNILNILDKTVGDIFSPLCRATFCDNKCKLLTDNYTFTGKIIEIKNDTEFLCSGNDISNKNKNYFKYGIIIFLDGENKNKIMEIKQSFDNDIILNSKMNYPLKIGDSFKIIAGCDKTFETCSKVFNNAINFRGEPDIASTSKVFKFY